MDAAHAPPSAPPLTASRRTSVGQPYWRDLALLALLSLAVSCTGLTAHGITNWQEAQRAVVARDMESHGSWIVPTLNGRPYLAKPPMIYWCQLGLAGLLGHPVGLFDLRLTVALAGVAGVLLTYVLSRRLLDDPVPAPTLRPADGAAWSRAAALWGSLFLATGTLYVRSSRVGELDILLVPFVVTAIGAVAAAWRRHRDERRAHLGAVALAAAAATGAAMTKGPPGILVVALTAYGGMAWWYAVADGVGEERPRRGLGSGAGRAGAAVGGLLCAGMGAWHAEGPRDLLGVALLGAIGAGVGALLGLLTQKRRAWACLVAYSRTHPVAVLGLPAAVLWLWGRAVAGRIGLSEALAMAGEEAEDNLRFFVPASPLANLGALSFGVGIGSVAAAAALVWFARSRPRWRPGWAIILAWVLLGFAAFSVLGKGVPRYLTPLWPGVAILGGVGAATALAGARRPGRARAALAVAVVALAAFQTWWYGAGRVRYEGARSPRDLVAELLAPPLSVDPARLATFEFRTPAIDYYAGRPVASVGDARLRAAVSGVEAWSPAQLLEHAGEEAGGMVVLLRLAQPADLSPVPAAERLAEAGMLVEPLPTSSVFVIDNGRTRVGAVRVRAAPR